jgi:NitT/TauT family transport system ATP-binding protein
MQPLIKLNSLSKSFGQTTVFHDIDLSIYEGSLISIIGPSGCGKTTLLKLIKGLINPSSGNIKKAYTTNLKYHPQEILVFQDYNRTLFPWFTVEENMRLVLHSSGLSESSINEKIKHYLMMVGLEKEISKYPWELSGGMQQRVALARALVIEPKVLLMDEPFGSLDARTRIQLEVELLKLWKDLGITIILVTHDIEEAIFLSNKIYFLRESSFSEYKIDIPYPRESVLTRNSVEFGNYRKLLNDCFNS